MAAALEKPAVLRYYMAIMNIISLVLLLFLAAELPIYGYIDPGTGSYVFQILIASLLAVSFVVRRFWDKIKIAMASLWGKIRGGSKS